MADQDFIDIDAGGNVQKNPLSTRRTLVFEKPLPIIPKAQKVVKSTPEDFNKFIQKAIDSSKHTLPPLPPAAISTEAKNINDLLNLTREAGNVPVGESRAFISNIGGKKEGIILENVGGKYRYSPMPPAYSLAYKNRFALERREAKLLTGQVEFLRAMKVTNALRRAAKVATVAAKVTVYSYVIDIAVQAIFRQIEKKAMKQYVKHVVKEQIRDHIRYIGKKCLTDIEEAKSNMRSSIEIDTTNFDKAIKQYATWCKKDYGVIVNQKAFNIAIKAYKETYKVDKNVIVQQMESPSRINPNLTVAEALALEKMRKKGEKITSTSLKREAKKITNIKISHAGFLKSGWIPAMKKFAPVVEKRLSIGVVNKQKGKEKGGGRPAPQGNTNDKVFSTIWNSIEADNSPRAHMHMRAGLQKAFNQEAADIMVYIKRKMDKNADKFNALP